MYSVYYIVGTFRTLKGRLCSVQAVVMQNNRQVTEDLPNCLYDHQSVIQNPKLGKYNIIGDWGFLSHDNGAREYPEFPIR